MHLAEKLILENLETKNSSLNLGKCKLRGNELCLQLLEQCTHLKELYLSDNQLSDIAPLKDLHNLTWLDLSKNKISDIAPLKDLHNLTKLNLHSNKISDIAPLKDLHNLTKLDLSFNQLSDIAPLKDLHNLTKLDLYGNQISDIAPLKDLHNLTKLDLSDNKISDISDLADLPALQKLILYGNTVRGIPQELLGKDNRDNCLEKVKPYFLDTDFVFEGKMVLVGEPAAGKTTMCEKILNASYKLKHTEAMTRGIAVSEWTFPYTNPKQTEMHEGFDGQFRAHIFDFGGQEIMHATHRYFFSRRTLYVLVVDTRPEDTDFHYWLSMIALFGEGSPVVIVMNDKHDKHKEVDAKILEMFAHLVGKRVFHVNLRDNKGLSDLVSCLQDELQCLPHVGEERIPKEWVQVRTELEKFWLPESLAQKINPFAKKHEKKPYLRIDEFVDICKTCNLKKEQKAISVAKILHILGSVLYFHENIHLQNFIILDKHWATEAVYLALLDKDVTQKMGKFEYKDLQRIWQGKYKPETHGALVELMLNFKIAYRVKNTEHTYIAPLLLKENPSEQVGELFPAQGQYTRFEYHYTKFMPKGLMARLIIEKNRQIYQDLQWRTGVVLEFHGCLVEATEHRYGSTNKMAFRIKGAEAGKALAVIYDAFKEIHGEFPNLEFEEMIPCCCVECRQDIKPHFFKHSYLQKAKTKLKTVNCEKSLAYVEVLQLLEGYEHETGRQGWEERINRGDFASFFSPENEAKMQDEDKPLFHALWNEFISGRYSQDFAQRAKALMRKNGF